MHLPSTITTSFKDFIDALHEHKSVLNWLDLPILLLTLIPVQVTYLNSQIIHYENCQNSCIDSKQEFYESLSGEDLLKIIDHGASNLTTTNPLYYVKETTEWRSTLNLIMSVCGENDVYWDTKDNEDFHNTSWHEAHFFINATSCLSLPHNFNSTIGTTSMTVYWNCFNLIGFNLPTSLQEALYVDHCLDNTLWKSALDSECD